MIDDFLKIRPLVHKKKTYGGVCVGKWGGVGCSGVCLWVGGGEKGGEGRGHNPAPSNNWQFPLTFPKKYVTILCGAELTSRAVVGLVCGRVRVGVWLWVSVSACSRTKRTGRIGRIGRTGRTGGTGSSAIHCVFFNSRSL